MKMEDVVFTHVGGLKTACIGRKQLVELIVNQISQYKVQSTPISPLTIFDSNGQGISIANSDPDFMKLLETADIIHADGQSVVAFSRMFSTTPIPERTPTTDTIHDIPLFDSSNIKHFLLGGKQSVVEKCANILDSKYSNFEIAGTHHGYFDESTEQQLIDTINNSGADILWVGLGKPKEQAFVVRNKSKLHVPVIITCGGCYNYITGDYKRAPEFMQKIGMEWLHRACTEPRKFMWRYITTNPHSIYCAWKHRTKA
ncbi:MAG: WecB/TagA/CpsF family glycosyltransferase [Alteromonadaceae bacterium]|nr:WecB/TagA/CpsF family glycosyltransferase [Alteromonadaceae bacterium]